MKDNSFVAVGMSVTKKTKVKGKRHSVAVGRVDIHSGTMWASSPTCEKEKGVT